MSKGIFDEVPTPDIRINGRPIEEFSRDEKMFHYDNDLVRNLGREIMMQAVRDYVDGDRRMRSKKVDARSATVYNYFTAKRFFESALFESITAVTMPEMDADEIRSAINKIRKVPNRIWTKKKKGMS